MDKKQPIIIYNIGGAVNTGIITGNVSIANNKSFNSDSFNDIKAEHSIIGNNNKIEHSFNSDSLNNRLDNSGKMNIAGGNITNKNEILKEIFELKKQILLLTENINKLYNKLL